MAISNRNRTDKFYSFNNKVLNRGSLHLVSFEFPISDLLASFGA